MKHVCMDARMILCSGIGTYIANLLLNLHNPPFALTLLLSKEGLSKHPSLRRFQTILCEAPIYSIKEQKDLPFLIPPCDLFFSPHYNIPLFPIRAKKRIVTIHDTAHLALGEHLTLLERMYARLVMKEAARRSEKILTVSAFSKGEISRRLDVPLEKIAVIYPSFDPQRFSSSLTYRIPTNPFFLFVGNLKPHKNLTGLLRSYLTALPELSNIHLLVVGASLGMRHIDQEAHVLALHPKLKNRVHFLGSVENGELALLYKNSLATILPSLYEGFGSVALESMHFGSPLASTNRASLPEVCEEAALYFDPLCEKSMKDTLIALAKDSDLRNTLAKRGKERSAFFSLQTFVEAHSSWLSTL